MARQAPQHEGDAGAELIPGTTRGAQPSKGNPTHVRSHPARPLIPGTYEAMKTNSTLIKSGINLRQFEIEARRLGCSIRVPHMTGELEFRHPVMDKPLRLNRRRKATERRAAVWLRKLRQRLGRNNNRTDRRSVTDQ